MKKIFVLMTLSLILVGLLTGCCSHVWYAATCTAPQTCQECGETKGEALGHTWQEATCTTPKTCTACKVTEGEALGHTWEEATTEAPKTCSVCALTEGEKINTDPRFTTAATKEFHGKWTCETVLTGEMLGTTGYLEELPVTLVYEFKNNGDVLQQVVIDDQLMFLDAMKKLTLDVTYATMAAQGVSKEQTDAAILAEQGMSTEEYVNKQVEGMDLEEFFESFADDGVYYVTESKIWIAPSWLNEFESSAYTLDGDSLVIEEITLEEDGEPLQWKRG